MPEVGATGEHELTGVGPVVIGAGHDVVVYEFPALAADTVHDATATFVVLLLEQVVVIHGDAVGVFGVQDETGVGPVVTGAGQVVVVQPLPDDGPEAEHEPTGTFVALLVPHVVAVYELPLDAVIGVQLETPTGPVVIGAGHVVAVQLLPEVAADAVQEATGTLVLLLVLQVVVVQAFPAVAQTASTSPPARSSSSSACRWSSCSCCRRAGPRRRARSDRHVRRVVGAAGRRGLGVARIGARGVHDGTPVGPVVLVVQVVVVQPLPDVAAVGVQAEARRRPGRVGHAGRGRVGVAGSRPWPGCRSAPARVRS